MSDSMLKLPIHRAVRFVLAKPHYPENLGASCRAMKTMGFTDVGLVRPGRLATPDHPMARKMAVKSLDVLDGAEVFDNLDEAVVGFDIVVGTTAKTGVSHIISPRLLGPKLLASANLGKKICIVFGNEKSGLTSAELSLCDLLLRAPLAADQPSLNLAQAVQLVAYELFVTALEERKAERRTSGLSHPDATRNPG